MRCMERGYLCVKLSAAARTMPRTFHTEHKMLPYSSSIRTVERLSVRGASDDEQVEFRAWPRAASIGSASRILCAGGLDRGSSRRLVSDLGMACGAVADQPHDGVAALIRR